MVSRKQKAWAAFWSMKKIWLDKTIHLQLKLKIFQSTCQAIFLYGSESWKITTELEKMINSFGTSSYRYILHKSWRDKVSNEKILKIVGKEDLITNVRRRQLKFIGKNLRQNETSKYVLYEPQIGRTKRGRPTLTYRKYIENITKKSSEELIKIAQKEKEWLLLIIGVT